MRITFSKQAGHILAAALFLTGIITLSVVSYMTFIGSQQTFIMRSGSWGQALPLAEAGVEEALTHINYYGTTNFGTFGWTLSSGAYARQRTLNDGFYTARISTASPPVITVSGYARLPMQTNYIARTVQVNTKRSASGSLIAVDSLTMSGAAFVDSFDSSNPLYSTNGAYTAAKATDTAYVGVLRSAAGAISTDSGRIYGRAATGPGGTVATDWGGGIGTRAWLATASGQGPMQPGHVSADLNTVIPVVPVPFTTGYMTPMAGTNNGTAYTYLLNGGDFELPVVNLSGIQKIIVTATSRLYVTGNFTMGNGTTLTIQNNCSLDLYVGGSQINITGAGIVNTSQNMNGLTLYGLSSVTNITAGNGTVFVGYIIAPAATLSITGSGNVSGAALVRAAVLGGSGAFHCDNALGTKNLKYVISSWSEL